MGAITPFSAAMMSAWDRDASAWRSGARPIAGSWQLLQRPLKRVSPLDAGCWAAPCPATAITATAATAPSAATSLLFILPPRAVFAAVDQSLRTQPSPDPGVRPPLRTVPTCRHRPYPAARAAPPDLCFNRLQMA